MTDSDYRSPEWLLIVPEHTVRNYYTDKCFNVKMLIYMYIYIYTVISY